MTPILVTGGAGYIGSSTCKALYRCGYLPVTVDNLIYGNRWAVKWGPLEEADIADTNKIQAVFEKYRPEAVIHFAAFAYVGESVQDPQKYYLNNVAGTLNLLSVMKNYECDKIIFSSTCATYGNPERIPIDESHRQVPVNPYGRSKLMIEQILQDFGSAYGMKHVILRYFNASGADPEGQIGESHDPETHLIPLAIKAALEGKSVQVFGKGYDTPDGTAIRDYIHVSDLAEAHCLSLKYLMDGNKSECFNLGTGRGYSVLEIINAVERVSGKKVRYDITDRRPGDPDKLIASSAKANGKLGWRCQYMELEPVIETAYRWHAEQIKAKRSDL